MVDLAVTATQVDYLALQIFLSTGCSYSLYVYYHKNNY